MSFDLVSDFTAVSNDEIYKRREQYATTYVKVIGIYGIVTAVLFVIILFFTGSSTINQLILSMISSMIYVLGSGLFFAFRKWGNAAAGIYVFLTLAFIGNFIASVARGSAIQINTIVFDVLLILFACLFLGSRRGRYFTIAALFCLAFGMYITMFHPLVTVTSDQNSIILEYSFTLLFTGTALVLAAASIWSLVGKQEDDIRGLVVTGEELNRKGKKESIDRENLVSVVREIVGYLDQVDQGKLDTRVIISSTQETGEDDLLVILGKRLNNTIARLEEMIQRIRDASIDLTSASTEILAATSQQASGASEQAAAITQTTSTVEEVKAISEQFISRSQEVSGTAQHSVEISRSGENVIQQTITSMDRIKAQVNSIAENILALSERTQQVGDIITTVNEIASQSNILALNAAVEAARAGEHGLGFAVVAAEVRNLAEQSRQATSQVRTILLDIQKAINTTVMVTEEGTKVVERGVQQAEQAGRAIQQLAGVIDESSLLAAQMSAAGRQQSTGIEQIAGAMQNIKLATVQGLTSTRQTEKAAQDLNHLAIQLQYTVSRIES